MIRTHTALILQALRIHSNDGTSSLPQSIDGEYVFNGRLSYAGAPGDAALRRSYLSDLDRRRVVAAR